MTNGNLDSYDKIMNEGLKLQRLIAKNPNAVYHMSFTRPDANRDGTEILLTITEFRTEECNNSARYRICEAVVKGQSELNSISKCVETLRIWGIESFRLDLNGKLSDSYKTQVAYPKADIKVGSQREIWDKIPKKQLTTEQIQHYIQMGRDLRGKEQKGEYMELTLGVKELGLSLDISPNFKENMAMFIVNDSLDYDSKEDLGLVDFAVAIIKLWDLQQFGIGKRQGGELMKSGRCWLPSEWK